MVEFQHQVTAVARIDSSFLKSKYPYWTIGCCPFLSLTPLQPPFHSDHHSPSAPPPCWNHRVSLQVPPVKSPQARTLDCSESSCLELHRLENVTRSYANGVVSRERVEWLTLGSTVPSDAVIYTTGLLFSRWVSGCGDLAACYRTSPSFQGRRREMPHPSFVGLRRGSLKTNNKSCGCWILE